MILQNLTDNQQNSTDQQHNQLLTGKAQQNNIQSGKQKGLDMLTNSKANWSNHEDNQLNAAVKKFGQKQWSMISSLVKTKNSRECLERYNQKLTMHQGNIHLPWSRLEDDLLIKFVAKKGQQWDQIGSMIQGRNAQQCKERWNNILSPTVKRGNWTTKEDELIFDLYKKFGSSWTKIAQFLPGRTQNSIKHRFYSTMRKLLVDQDPSQKDVTLPDTSIEKNTQTNSLFQMLIQNQTDKDLDSSKIQQAKFMQEQKKTHLNKVKLKAEQKVTRFYPKFIFRKFRTKNLTVCMIHQLKSHI